MLNAEYPKINPQQCRLLTAGQLIIINFIATTLFDWYCDCVLYAKFLSSKIRMYSFIVGYKTNAEHTIHKIFAINSYNGI